MLHAIGIKYRVIRIHWIGIRLNKISLPTSRSLYGLNQTIQSGINEFLSCYNTPRCYHRVKARPTSYSTSL